MPEEDAFYFYVIQVDPILRPNRIKLGISKNLRKRLILYQRICPEAKILKTWVCKRSWETLLIMCATIDNSHQIKGELYEIIDLPKMIVRIDAIFTTFPEIKDRNPGMNSKEFEVFCHSMFHHIGV